MDKELKDAISHLIRSACPTPEQISDGLRQAMDQLRAVSGQLNQATDEATRLIVQVERFLNQECSLGIAAGVILNESPMEQGLRRQVELKYGRLSKGFGLSICTKELAGDVITARTSTPLLQAPRTEKLQAVAQLPALLVKLSQKATELAARAQESCKAVGRIFNDTPGS